MITHLGEEAVSTCLNADDCVIELELPTCGVSVRSAHVADALVLALPVVLVNAINLDSRSHILVPSNAAKLRQWQRTPDLGVNVSHLPLAAVDLGAENGTGPMGCGKP